MKSITIKIVAEEVIAAIESHISKLEIKARKDGRRLAKRGVRDLSMHLFNIDSNLLQEFKKVCLRLNIKDKMLQVIKDRVHFANLIDDNEVAQEELEYERDKAEEPDENILAENPPRQWWRYLWLVMVFLFELVFIYRNWENLGESKVQAWIAAPALASILMRASHGIIQVWFTKIARPLKIVIVVAICTAIITLLFTMAGVSLDYVSNVIEKKVPLTDKTLKSRALFFLSSLMAVIATCIIEFFAIRSREARRLYKREKKKEEKIANLNAKIEAHKQEHKVLVAQQYEHEKATQGESTFIIALFELLEEGKRFLGSTLVARYKEYTKLPPLNTDEFFTPRVTSIDIIYQKVLRALATLLFAMSTISISAQSIDISYFNDMTYHDSMTVDTTDIVAQLLPMRFLWHDISVRIREISDISYGDEYVFTLPKENRYTTSRRRRENDFANLRDQVTATLRILAERSHGKPETVLIPIIWRELERQSGSGKDETLLVIRSDMMEHYGPSLSFYDQKTLQQFAHYPEQICKQLGLSFPLRGSPHMTMHILYRPKDADENRRFNLVIQGWRNLLEDTGIRLKVGSQLNFLK